MQGGAGPPSGTPPLVGDVGGAFGASLRAWMQGRAIPGRRTRTPGRSPCFRTLRVSFHPSCCRRAWVTDVLLVASIRWGAVGPLLLISLVIMGSPGPATISLLAAGSVRGVRRSLPYLIGIIAGTT